MDSVIGGLLLLSACGLAPGLVVALGAYLARRVGVLPRWSVRSIFRRTPARAFVFVMLVLQLMGLVSAVLFTLFDIEWNDFRGQLMLLPVAAMLMLTVFIFRPAHPNLDLGFRGGWKRSGVLAVGGFAAAFIWSHFYIFASEPLPPTENVYSLYLSEEWLLGLLLPATVVRTLGFGLSALVGPIAEEVFFRGYLIPALSRTRALSHATLISSLFFAIWHLSTNWFLYFFVAGLIFAEVWRRGGLKASIGAHALFNASIDVMASL